VNIKIYILSLKFIQILPDFLNAFPITTGLNTLLPPWKILKTPEVENNSYEPSIIKPFPFPAEKPRKNGYAVIFPPQLGRAEHGWEEISIEVETRADHAEQVLRNYEKNVRAGRKVVFVVPSESIAERVKRILEGKNDYTIEIIEAEEKRE